MQTVAKAVQVLHAFTREHPEWTVTGLSARLGWHKAIVHRLLATLTQGDMLYRDPVTRRYRIGPGIMELAGVFLSEEPLLRHGAPLLHALAQASSHTAALAVLRGAEVLYLAAAEGTAELKSTARAGDRRAAHATASGKVLLASLPPEHLDAFFAAHPLPPLTPRTITDQAALRRELDRVRAQGFALNVEERHVGMIGVAAPVRDHQGAVAAAISLGFPRHLSDPEEIDRAVRLAVRTANDLSRRLGAPAESLVRERGVYVPPAAAR